MSSDSRNPMTGATGDAAPKEGWSPAPIALIVFFALLVYWGMVYLDDHGGGFNPKVYRPYESYLTLNDVQPKLDPDAQLVKDGEKIFNNNCATCHQSSGVGSPATGCPPLVGSEWATASGPYRIIRLVLNGGGGPITVKGQQYAGSTPMTSFKDLRTDYELAAALSYVRNAWGNKASTVKPEQVKQVRAEIASRRIPWTAPELLLVDPDKD